MSKSKKTSRIYYGHNPETGERLYWTVKVKDAVKPVTVDGKLIHAIQGQPGVTVGCHLSYCARDNASAFPHPCKLVAFTRSTALVVTKISKGQPSAAVKYGHGYSYLVELNDKQFNKTFIKNHPELAERKFKLRPPRPYRPYPGVHTETGDKKYTTRAFVPRGAMRRAIDAGYVTAGMETQGFE